MDIEKVVNSKWYSGFDWFFKLMVLNILTILIPAVIGGGPFLYWNFNREESLVYVIISLILFIFAFIPCYITSFSIIKLYKEEKTENVFKLFFGNLLNIFKQIYKIELILIPIMALFTYGALYYWTKLGPNYFNDFDLSGIISILGFVVLSFSIFSTFLAFMHLPMIVSYFRMNFMNYLKLSYYFAYKYFFKSIFYAIILVAPLVILIDVFGLGSFFGPVYLLFGISVPLYIIYLSSRELYWYLSNNIEDLKKENKYELEGENNENRN